MNDWIKLTDEAPIMDSWWLDGFATIKVPGYPLRVAQGTFLTYKELLRSEEHRKYAPYTSYPGRKFNPEDVMFIEEGNVEYVYPPNSIVAWMPWPEPYKLAENEYLCTSCGRLCKRTNKDQVMCLECEEKFAKTQNMREKLFEILMEDNP